MKRPISKRIILCVLCLALVLGCAGLGAAAAELPARAELQSGVDAINDKLPMYQHIQMINTCAQPFDKTGTKKIKRHSVKEK